MRKTNHWDRSCLIFPILFILSFSISAQDISKDITIPPSPNAASLGKYGEIPVNKSRGIPSIEIPIYSIQVDDITVPISLTFHAGGFKVGTTASWTGLGWSLNAGGVVTRSMRGKPDESGYFYNMNQILEWEQDGILDWIYYPYIDQLPDWYTNIVNNTDRQLEACRILERILNNDGACSTIQERALRLQQFEMHLSHLYYVPPGDPVKISALKDRMAEIYYQQWDVQPDLFFYNYPGGSGKLMFNPDKSIIQFPYQDVKIDAYINDHQNGPPGLDLEGSLGNWAFNDPSGLVYNFNVPELSILEVQNVDKMRFNSAWYLGSINSQMSNKTVSFSYSDNIQFNGGAIANTSITELHDFPKPLSNDPPYSFTTTENISYSYPTYITRYLEEIVWEGGIIKFLPGNQREDIPGSRQLGKIEIYNQEIFNDPNAAPIKYFEFKYSYVNGVNAQGGLPNSKYMMLDSIIEYSSNGTPKPPYIFNYDLGDIPSVNSFAQDHYGYYNGKHNNNTLVPSYYNDNFGVYQEKADRSSAFSKAGLLKKITYPTGGTSEFNYEPNDYYTFDINTENVFGVAEHCYPDGSLYENPDGTVEIGLLCNDFSESQPITIGDNSLKNIIKVEIEYDYENRTENYSGQDFVGVIVKEVGTSNELIYHGIYDQEIVNQLENGKTYTITASSNIIGTKVRGTIINEYSTYTNKITGGVRLESMVHTADGNNPPRTIKYDYTKKDDPTISSGSLNSISGPLAYTKSHYNSGLLDEYIVHSAQPVGFLGAFTSDHIIYSEVTEYEENNGGTRTFFSVPPDTRVFPEELPIFNRMPVEVGTISNFWKRGKILREEIFNDQGELIRIIENNYEFVKKDSSRTFIYEIFDDWNHLNNNANEYKFDFSHHFSGWAKLNSTVTTYQDGLVEIVNNTYDQNSPLLLPIEIDKVLGDGLDSKEVITYLNDRNNHIIAPVTNIKIYNDQDVLLNEIVSTYNGAFKLIESESLDGNGQQISKTNYSDHNGLKPSYFQPHTGVNTVILWGYNNTLPVAQIQNVTMTEVNTAISAAKASDPTFDLDIGGFTPEEQNRLKELLPDDALLTAYQHLPLVGMVEQVDPNGIKTTYEYDEFNRLLRIRDHQDNILKQFEYHYNGQ